MIVDGDDVYYYNHGTKSSSWDRPRMQPVDLPSGWRRHLDAEGDVFYFNENTVCVTRSFWSWAACRHLANRGLQPSLQPDRVHRVKALGSVLPHRMVPQPAALLLMEVGAVGAARQPPTDLKKRH